MKHTEFRESLLSSLVETIQDVRKKRDETSNPLAHVIHTGQLELLNNLLQWAGSLEIEECCHVDADHDFSDGPIPAAGPNLSVIADDEPIRCAGCNGTCGTCLCDPACNAIDQGSDPQAPADLPYLPDDFFADAPDGSPDG